NGFLIRNTTITGNSSQANTTGGGGLSLAITGSGTALIANSTITRNTAAAGPGGGISAASSGSGLIDLENNIIAQNGATFASDLSSNTKPFVANYNVIGVLTGSAPLSTTAGNQAGTTISPLDPILSPIANNGGLTRTIRPYGGSPAVDSTNPLGSV